MKNNNVNSNNNFRRDSSVLHIDIQVCNVYSAIIEANGSQNALLTFLLVEIEDNCSTTSCSMVWTS